MESRIEKMNKMRRNILIGIFIGTLMTFAYMVYNLAFLLFRGLTGLKIAFWLYVIWHVAWGIRYLMYKRSLLKDPFLRSSVNDERVKLNWLRAFRIAFLVLLSMAIFWYWYDSSYFPLDWREKIILPHGPWLIWFGSILGLTGSFLFYNREAKG